MGPRMAPRPAAGDERATPALALAVGLEPWAHAADR